MKVEVLKIVVASPSDVQAERDTLNTVAEELNRGIAALCGLRIEIARWETDAYPGFHLDGPQGLIDSILRIEECDVLIGIFWKRFGTPTKDAESGTEHEIQRAYAAWKKKERPQIMVYFNKRAFMPESQEEIDQMGLVLKFKKEFPKKGLRWDYNGPEEFERLVRNHLTQFIRQQCTSPPPDKDKSIWVSPIYKFNQPFGEDEDGNQLYRQIVIDVTRSAPSFDSVGKALKKTLNESIKKAKLDKPMRILDFGAGKLRNTLFLLALGYEVCAVEYRDLFGKSDQAMANWIKAKDKDYEDQFSTLIYPHEFRDSNQKFGMVLLINLINIMPVAAERLLVLQYCHEKLEPGGYLLWYTQRGDADYRGRLVPQYRLGDGYYMGRSSKYKTFYREYTVAEIDDLLASAGFEFVCSIDATWRNQARLYRVLEVSPLTKVLNAEVIASSHVSDERIPEPEAVEPRLVASKTHKTKGNPDPPKLKRVYLAEKALQKIPLGSKHATEYALHVKTMFELLFPGEFRGLKLEVIVSEKGERIVIIGRMRSKSGFFHSLKEDFEFKCPYMVIECKNYQHNLKNPEFDQLGGLLGKNLGIFGILAYRSASNRQTVINRCKTYFDNEGKVILPLTDADFREMLSLKAVGKEDELEAYLEQILQEVIRGCF